MLLFTASACVVLVFSAILMAAESIASAVFSQLKPSENHNWKEGVSEVNFPSKNLS